MKGSTAQTFRFFLSCFFAVLLLAACGGNGSSNLASTGTLKTSLTDSSTEDYRAIYVTIERVDVHFARGGWKTVATPGGTYNLLALVNGVRKELGISELDAGHYTQMRLIIGTTAETPATNILGDPHPFANYVIAQSTPPVVDELKLPSGFNSGIKIVSGFDISENETTELILDFDAMQSVVMAGTGGKHLLKPTIKVLNTVDAALVSGRVSAGSNGIEGALVSAQTYTSDLVLDEAERINVERSTLTTADDINTSDDETGEYRIYLPAGNYNLVAYATGFHPRCKAVSLTVDTPTPQDFTLLPAVTGTITETVTVNNPDPDQHVTLDFRQAGHCTDPSAMINVKTLKIATTGTFSVILPIGDYQIVASSSGKTTQTTDNVSVTENMITTHDSTF